MKNELLNFVSKAIQIPSYSDQEEKMAHFIYDEMVKLGYDDVMIDTTGNVIGKMGNGAKIIQFDSHMDTVEVNDGDILQNSRLNQVFDGTVVSHNVSSTNNTTLFDTFIISDRYNNGSRLEVSVDNVSMGSIGGIFENNSSYNIAVNGQVIESIEYINNSFENDTIEFDFEGHDYRINIVSNNITTIHHFVNSQEGNFFDFRTY